MNSEDFPMREATPEECAELKTLFETILQIPLVKDYDALRERLKAGGVVPFAITANVPGVMGSWDEIVEQQWKLLWPLMESFTFHDPMHARVSTDGRIAVCAFTGTNNVRGVPTMYRNSCIVMRSALDQPWRMVHFHVSRDPRVPGPAETFDDAK